MFPILCTNLCPYFVLDNLSVPSISKEVFAQSYVSHVCLVIALLTVYANKSCQLKTVFKTYKYTVVIFVSKYLSRKLFLLKTI